MASGTQNLTTYKANILAHTPDDTSLFLRGDNVWTNILNGTLDLKNDLNLYTSSADSPDITWWYANKETEQARIWVGSGGTSTFAPYYRCYNSSGTQLYSGHLVLGNGTGASGTWSISISGNAATATRINGNLVAATSDVNRNIWVSSSGNADGIPNYISGFYMNPSTKIFNVPASTRISPSAGALYLGNSGNQNWVYVQDMCSQDGQKWKIHQSGAAEFNGTVTAPTFSGNATSATYLKDRTNNNATYANYGAAGLAASAITWLCCWNGYEVRAISKAETMAAVRGAASGSWAISVTGSSASCTGNSNTANYQNCVATNEIRYARNGNMQSASDLWQGWAFAEGKVAVINGWRFGNGNGGLAPIYGSKIYNAVWNDFAEYRISDITEGGRVLVSDGKGHLILSTKRLQPSARVISDTFGCSVGMSDSAKTPIGVAGRVLVYPYQPRENYKVGDVLCAAPNGTADIMTREEIIQFPDRIIGIVDEVPDYEIWDQIHTNKKDDGEVGEQNHTNIEVKGRIWIYVR